MSACDLKIVLDRPEAVYAPGDSISGSVELLTNEPARCNKLTVKLAWRTDGESNQDLGPKVPETTLFAGTWKRGKRASLRFEVSAPPGPFSYQGHHFSVGWYVQASADLAAMSDSHAEQKVTIHPGGPVGAYDFGPKSGFVDDLVGGAGSPLIGMGLRSRYQRGRAGWLNWCLAIPLTLILAAVLVAGVMTAYDRLSRGEFSADLLWAVLVVPTVGVVLIAYGRYLLKPILAGSKLGEVDIRLASRRFQPGEEVRYTIACRPRATVTVESLTVKLVAREEATFGYGRSSSVREQVVFATENVECERIAGAGEDTTWTGALRVPEDAPASFFAENNELLWSLDVVFSVQKWADRESRHFVVVGPPPAEPIVTQAAPTGGSTGS